MFSMHTQLKCHSQAMSLNDRKTFFFPVGLFKHRDMDKAFFSDVLIFSCRQLQEGKNNPGFLG